MKHLPHLLKKAAAYVAAATFYILFSQSSYTRAQSLAIMPIMATLPAGERSVSFTITNKGGGPTSLQARAFLWKQDETDEKLLDTQDVILSPPLTTIAPGQSQVVRFFLRGIPPADKEINYRLILDQLPGTKTTGQVQMLLRLSIPVFVEPQSKLFPEVSFSLRRDGDQLTLVGVNKSGHHDKLQDVLLQTADGRQFTLDPGVGLYILAGNTRNWPVKITGSTPAIGTSIHLHARGEGHVIDRELAIVAGN